MLQKFSGTLEPQQKWEPNFDQNSGKTAKTWKLNFVEMEFLGGEMKSGEAKEVNLFSNQM